jgi:hypothetical protein
VLRYFIALFVCLVAVGSDVTLAQGRRDRPRDLNAYSLRYWSRDTLRMGQTVSTQTPYGILTCWSTGAGRRRHCTLR